MEVVLLGGDLSAYSVAISFHAEFGVKSTAFCRYRCGITGYSSLIDLHIEPDILDDIIGTSILLRFANERKSRPYLIPCGDWYVAFLSRNREALQNAYRFLIPSEEIFEKASDKARFYEMLEKEGLPYPKTRVLSSDDLSLSRFLSDWKYPAVLKPSQSVSYYAHPFSGMAKVYFPKTPKEALDTAEKIFAAGYEDRLILQERIGSEDKKPIAKTLTLLSDHNGIVRRGVLGEVWVEEQAKGARGNYAAILTRPPDALTCQLISLVEKIGYVGVSNFDILSYEGKEYLLELNPRHGRSCDYLRASGVSLARFFVDAIDGNSIPTDLSSHMRLWHAVPLFAVRGNVSKNEREALTALKRRGRTTSVFQYEGERKTLRRCAYLQIHALRRTIALKNRKAKQNGKAFQKEN